MVLTEDEYRALLKAAGRLDWRFRVALVLAHESGHREPTPETSEIEGQRNFTIPVSCARRRRHSPPKLVQ